MLSNACQYAIRSVLYLSIYSDESEIVGVKKIVEELETPQPFLAKILQKLSRAGLVSSIKGPHGGFYLSKKDRKNSVWDVVVCIDGEEKFVQCFMGLKECNEAHPCPVHHVVAPFKDEILKDFREKTIAEYAQKIKDNKNMSIKNFNP